MLTAPVIGMLHNQKLNRYHPVFFLYSPLPGPPDPDKPSRHKSKMHHTGGFENREEAVENARTALAAAVEANYALGEPVRFCLSKDFPWDGEGVPASTEFFVEGEDGEVRPTI